MYKSELSRFGATPPWSYGFLAGKLIYYWESRRQPIEINPVSRSGQRRFQVAGRPILPRNVFDGTSGSGPAFSTRGQHEEERYAGIIALGCPRRDRRRRRRLLFGSRGALT
jgi:hypothetical protein